MVTQRGLSAVVVVIGSEAAKARVKDVNGLSLAELFAPFGGHFRGISVSAQSLERQIPIENLRVRYADADLAVQLSTLQADQVAAWTVESSALAGRPNSLEPPSPWYEQWRNALFGSLRWSEHEALDQPAAAMLVVLSKEPDPVMQLEQLLHASKMPPLCTQGVLDPVPSRVAVLLHDVSDPESPTQEDFYQESGKHQGTFCPESGLGASNQPWRRSGLSGCLEAANHGQKAQPFSSSLCEFLTVRRQTSSCQRQRPRCFI